MGTVLVHGGGFAGSCWDPLLPHLTDPDVVAVDLPGRGRNPADLATTTIADFVGTVVDAVEAQGDDVLLVGHSLAGVTLPGVVARVGDRLRRVVFVSCMVPAPGGTVMSGLRLEDVEGLEALDLEELASAPDAGVEDVLDPELARIMFCNDMDEDQVAATLSIMTAESRGVISEPVDVSGLAHPVPKTWIRLLDDAILTPGLQSEMAARIPGCEVVDLDAGHMAMITRPAALAALINAR